MPRHEHRQERPLQDRHRLRDRSEARDGRDERAPDRAPGSRSDLKLYVRFDPTLNGNGGGQGGLTSPGEEGDNAGADSGTVVGDHAHNVLVGSDPETKTIAANRDYAVPVYSALNADRPFRAVSNGFAGKDSDGLAQLDSASRA